ncbi:MAG: Rid family detoxifying hydrolase [Humidesulfovibrio sp.]|uniref:Rid family detoxifying hydrolase n=1 Tax=Humidesulfovibrio sp. TaxID=2910988 RepID=UPI00273367B3|nr:Rid family detoxifying hydrolase [Humidesulfovibrio sp.]MDP2849044.1 Rid family detoxifying hydrolase [Humidesulfovibrio sp.]
MPLELKVVHTNAAPAAIGPYSQAIACGGTVYLSGQLGCDPGTGVLPEDFAVQTRQALTNLKTIVEASGSSLERVVSVDVYLLEMTNFGAFNEIYAEFFPQHRPARAVIGVAALPREAQVEIRCIAALAG